MTEIEAELKRLGISKDEIIGFHYNELDDQFIIFKKNQLVNHLNLVVPNVNMSFDKYYELELNKVSEIVSYSQSIVYLAKKDHSDSVISNISQLLENSITTLVASIHLLRSGFRLQSGTLLRTIFEICSVVLHIKYDITVLNKLLDNTLKSTKSITFAQNKIPLFGRMNGLLSNGFVHINQVHTLFYNNDEFTSNENLQDNILLGMIGTSATILEITLELALNSYINKPKYWEIKKDGKTLKAIFNPLKEEQIEWFTKHLNKHINN